MSVHLFNSFQRRACNNMAFPAIQPITKIPIENKHFFLHGLFNVLDIIPISVYEV